MRLIKNKKNENENEINEINEINKNENDKIILTLTIKQVRALYKCIEMDNLSEEDDQLLWEIHEMICSLTVQEET